MDNNIKVNVEVSSNGTTDRETKAAKALKAAYDDAAASAGKIKAGGTGSSRTVAGGTGGSRAVAAASQPVGAQLQQRNIERGAAELTGASARDFANQAQGLGGLVRLYATYAANIFAVSAAFRALSTAMDTTNMVRGLDQLGAATGRNLGGLSKRIAELSDGALSLRESMQTVAQTSASGMSSKNIERLVVVAKNASVALGRDLPDSVDRLSRGISKLEPELLDELGIMTKIEPAVQAYARQVGKAATQLTDFERRQAFANAVLKEGEDKFGAIAGIATNPFSKLLANLKNLFQSGMEFLNTFLGPLVNILASSPTALAAAVGAVGIALTKQALPALGQFKAGLESKKEKSQELATKKVSDAIAARSLLTETTLKNEYKYGDLQVEQLDNLQKIGRARQEYAGKELIVNKILKKDIMDVTEKDLTRLRVQAQRFDKQNKSKEADFYRQVADTLESSYNTEMKIIGAKKQAEEKTERDLNNKRTILGLNKSIADAAQKDAFKSGIASNAAYNASLIGISGAWKIAKEEINSGATALGKVEKAGLMARIGFAALGGALSTVGTALNAALGWIGLIITAIGFLDAWLSKSSKESELFSKSIDDLSSSVENTTRTLDNLGKKGGFASATIQGIFAMSNAMQDLRDKTEEAINSATKVKMAMGGWDQLKDSISSLFGGGVDKNLAENLTKSVQSALKIATASGLGEDFQNTIKQLLKIDTLDTKSMQKALTDLSESAKLELVSALTKLNSKVAESNSTLQSYKSATEDTTKAYQEFIQSTADTNPLFKLGTSLEKIGQTMLDILSKGPKELTAAMLDLAKSPEKGVLFGSSFVTQLLQIRSQFLDSQKAAGDYNKEIQELNISLETNKAIISELRKESPTLRTGEQSRVLADAVKEQKRLETERESAGKRMIRAVDTYGDPAKVAKVATTIFTEGMNVAFKKGGELIAQALGQASEKAALTVAKASAAGLTGEARAKEDTRIALRDIDLKEQGIRTSIDLILAQERLTAAINVSNALVDEERLTKEGSAATQGEKDRAISVRMAAQAYEGILGKEGSRPQFNNIPELSDKLANSILQSLIMSARQRIAPQEAALKIVGGERTAADITGTMAQTSGRAQDVEKQKAAETAINDVLRTRNEILSGIVGINSQELLNTKYNLDLKQLTAKQESEIRSINTEIANAQTALNTAVGKEARANAETNLERAKGIKASIEQKQEEEKINLALDSRAKKLQAELEQQNRLLEINKSKLELQNIISQSSLDISTAEFDALQATSNLSQTYIINQKSALDLRKAELDYINQSGRLELDYANKKYELEAKLKLLRDTAATSPNQNIEQIAGLEVEQARQKVLFDNAIAGLSIQLNTRRAILDIQKNSNLEQERYNELLSGANFIANELGSVFGDLGKSIGDVAKSIANFSVNSEKGSKALIDAEKKLADARANAEIDPSANLDDIKKQEKEVGKLRAKNTAQELSDMASIAGATKGFFKEKTLAYKVMQRTEQALHLASMAMQIKAMLLDKTSLASKLVSNATGIASDGAAAVVSGIRSVVDAIKGPFPMNIIAGAATAAAVSGILAAIGKGVSGPKGGGSPAITAEQQQKVQGSAMAYNTSSSSMMVTENGQQREVQPGEQYQFRRGALGDPTAKSEVVAKAIEVLTDVQVDNYTVNLDMLTALYQIEAGIRGVSAGIYTIPGIVSGSPFGTKEGGSGVNILGGLFGSKTSRQIIDSGLKFSGSLLDLSKSASGLVSVFETVQTTSTRSLAFIKSQSVRVSTQTQTLAEQDTPQARRLALFIQKTFKSSLDFLESAAEDAGFGRAAAQAIIATLGPIPEALQTFSTRGLKPDEIGPAFQAYIGSLNDWAAEKIFGSAFDSLALAGEEILTTVVRVVNQNKQATQAFKNLGFGDIAKEIAQLPENVGKSALDLQVAVGVYTQNLIDLAGGAEEFFNSLSFIEENFVPEVRRDAVRQSSARETINRELGARGLTEQEIGGIKTRDDYINSLNAAQRAAQRGDVGADKLFNTLRALGPSFDAILPPLDKSVASAEKVRDEVKKLSQQSKKLSNDLERVNVTDYARSLGNISDSFTEAIDNLKEAGTLTTETFNIQVAISKAQEAILNAQNKAKASQIIETLNKEVASKSLEPLSKEIDSIRDKARDSTNQLINLNQATAGNIQAVREWEASLMQAARTAALSAQEIQYADLFSGSKVTSLTIKFRNLGLKLPSSIKGFQQLIDSVDTTTDAGIDLRGSLLGLGSEFNSLIEQVSNSLRSAYQARVEEIKGARDQFKGIVDSLKDFKLSLLTGAQSPLTPAEKYQATKSEFERVAELASRGDAGAIQKLQGASTAFLEASRTMYSSSEQYTQDFKQVLSVVDSTQSFAEIQVEIAQNTLLEIEKAVGSLIDIKNIALDTKAVILTGLGETLSESISNFTELSATQAQDQANQQAIADRNNANRLNATTQSGVDLAKANTSENVAAIQALEAAIEAGRIDSIKADANRTRLSTESINQNVTTAVDRIIALMPPKDAPATPSATDAAAVPGGGTGDNYYYYGNAGSGEGIGGGDGSGVGPGAGGSDGFAVGTNYLPKDMTARVHKGERIIPAADNRELMNRLAERNELQGEIVKLNLAIKDLQQIVAQGAVLNVEATNRNTEAITETISESSKDVQYMKKVKNRTSIV